MNFKLITKALQLFSTLTSDDLDLALKLHKMSDTEREGLLIALGPQKASKKSTERVIEHCADCDYMRRAKVHKDATVSGYHEFQPTKKPAGKGGGGKSARASGMAAQLNKSLQGQRRATADESDDDGLVLCEHVFDGGGTCLRPADHNIHHLQTDSLYHEFVAPPAAGKSDAQSAAGGS